MLLMLSSVARAACTFEASAEGLDAALLHAEEAYASMDLAAFQHASTESDFLVPCLSEPVSSATAARLHRLRGLGYFAEGDPEATSSALRAARELDPDYVFPESVLPVGFELRDLYEGLPAETGEAKRLTRPRRGELWLDGSVGRLRARSRSVLYQRTDAMGTVVDTAYLAPGDEVPWYPGIRKRQTGWLLASAGTGVAAGVLYGFAWQSFNPANQRDPSWTEDDLARMRTENNVLFWSSVGLTTAALAQAVVAFRVDR